VPGGSLTWMTLLTNRASLGNCIVQARPAVAH
jgi:hypothetical protein